jgi:hypothetical protein
VTCHDAREQLSALLDDALPVPDRQALEAHLSVCAECRRELEQLQTTMALLGRLPPVHAPAGFVDRVMAEAYRPSQPRRLLDALFRPLRVKLPIEAAAVLLVGVSALYVYQRAPEVQRLARQETRESPPPSTVTPPPAAVPPAPEVQQFARQEARESPRPSTVTPPPAGAPPAAGAGGEPSRFRDQASVTKGAPVEEGAAGEEARQAPPAAALSAPPAPTSPPARGGDVREAPAARSEPSLKSNLEPKFEKEAQVERRPDAGGGAGTPSGMGKVAQSADPSPSRDAARAQAATTPSPAEKAAPSVAAPAPEARARAGGVASAPPAAPTTEGAPGDALSSAKSRSAARLMRAVDASGRLAVPAREPAEAALDGLLRRLGAARVARRLEGQGMVLIDVVVPAARYRELIEGLGHIGRWTPEHEAKTLPPEVRVEVAVTVEP